MAAFPPGVELSDVPVNVDELPDDDASELLQPSSSTSFSYRQQLEDSTFDRFNYSGSKLSEAGPFASWIYGSMKPKMTQETHLLTDAAAVEKLSSAPQTLESIGELTIQDTLTGEYVTVASLWQEQPVVIGFFRRFGCRLCRWGALQLSRLKPLLDAANVRLIAIGFEAQGLQSFVDGKFFDGEVFVDLTKTCYRRLGLQNLGFFRGMAALLTDRRVARSLKMAKDVPLGDFQGDGMQLGATFVVAKGGAVVLEHRQQHFGDFPVLDDICSAVTSMGQADDLPKLNLIVDATKRRKGRRRASRDRSTPPSNSLSPQDSDDGSGDLSRRASTMTSPRSTSPSPTSSHTDSLLAALASTDQNQPPTRPARNPWTSQTVAEAQACKDCSPSQAHLVEDDTATVAVTTFSSKASHGRVRTRRPSRQRSHNDTPLQGLG
eukprot:m.51949 g.51949  ORF g.51949 m.51949 type:complete len:434 (+) comp13468_c0_seq1:33-1334(+)